MTDPTSPSTDNPNQGVPMTDPPNTSTPNPSHGVPMTDDDESTADTQRSPTCEWLNTQPHLEVNR